MRKNILLCVVACLCTVLLVGCTKKTDNKKEDGGDFKITLDSNPTTGYSWSFTRSDDIIDINNEYIQDDSEENMDGVGGKEVFTITPKKAGTVTLSFVYSRAWEDKSEDEKTAEYVLVIDEDLTIKETHSGTYFE